MLIKENDSESDNDNVIVINTGFSEEVKKPEHISLSKFIFANLTDIDIEGNEEDYEEESEDYEEGSEDYEEHSTEYRDSQETPTLSEQLSEKISKSTFNKVSSGVPSYIREKDSTIMGVQNTSKEDFEASSLANEISEDVMKQLHQTIIPSDEETIFDGIDINDYISPNSQKVQFVEPIKPKKTINKKAPTYRETMENLKNLNLDEAQVENDDSSEKSMFTMLFKNDEEKSKKSTSKVPQEAEKENSFEKNPTNDSKGIEKKNPADNEKSQREENEKYQRMKSYPKKKNSKIKDPDNWRQLSNEQLNGIPLDNEESLSLSDDNEDKQTVDTKTESKNIIIIREYGNSKESSTIPRTQHYSRPSKSTSESRTSTSSSNSSKLGKEKSAKTLPLESKTMRICRECTEKIFKEKLKSNL